MSHTAPVGLHDSDLSAIYLAADATSGRGQRRTKLLIRTELVSLIVASVAGLTVWRIGGGYDVLAVVSALAFLLALACTLVRALTRPEGSWYAGRAAAESARTLGWRYAVGGAPFPDHEPEAAVNERFLRRLREVVEQLKDTALVGPDSTAQTARRMRALTNSIAFVRQMTLRISTSNPRNGTNSAQAFSHSRTTAG